MRTIFRLDRLYNLYHWSCTILVRLHRSQGGATAFGTTTFSITTNVGAFRNAVFIIVMLSVAIKPAESLVSVVMLCPYVERCK